MKRTKKPQKQKAEKRSISAPSKLWDAVDKKVLEQGINTSRYVQDLIKNSIAA